MNTNFRTILALRFLLYFCSKLIFLLLALSHHFNTHRTEFMFYLFQRLFREKKKANAT